MRDSNSIAVDLFGILRFLRRNLLILLASTIVVAGLAVVALMVKPFGFRATVELLTNPQPLQIVGRDIQPTTASGSIDIANIDSQPALITSAALLRRVVTDLDLRNDPQFAPKVPLSAEDDVTSVIEPLRKSMTVERVGQSLVFRIGVLHRRAERAAEIANAIAQAYLDLVATTRRSNTAAAIRTLEGQSEDLRRQLDGKAKAVEIYRADNNLISSAVNGPVIDQQIGDLTARIGATRAELARLDARLANRNAPVDTADDAENGPNSMLGSLRTQKTRIALEEARLARTMGPQHPSLLEVTRQRETVDELITKEQQRLLERTRSEREKTATLLASLTKQAAKLADTQKSSNTANVDLQALERDAAAVRLVYEDTLKRITELKQQLDLPNLNARIISRAEIPTRSEAPPLPLIAAATLLFGLALGIAGAYLREFLGAATSRAPAAVAAVESVAEAVSGEPDGTHGEMPPPPDAGADREPPRLAAVDGRHEPSQNIADRLGIELLATLPRARRRTTGAGEKSVYAGRLEDLGLRLLLALGRKRPATIVLVAFGDGVDTGALGRRLAATLDGFGSETSYFRALPGAEAGRHFVVDDFAGGEERGRVIGRGRFGGARGGGDSLSIVDLGAFVGEIDVAPLLKVADAIVVVADGQTASGRRIARFRESLGGAFARVVGLVVVGGVDEGTRAA